MLPLLQASSLKTAHVHDSGGIFSQIIVRFLKFPQSDKSFLGDKQHNLWAVVNILHIATPAFFIPQELMIEI